MHLNEFYTLHPFWCHLVKAQVRAFITCRECGKRRLIYSAAKLTTPELSSVTRVDEELVYICGNPLFYAGIHRDHIIAKEGL
ncbi:hypothetical protein DPMN_009701 [Dreissena polymorpha]|uniref:Uncharacterized protein n=1 Tax=Dreissena polymorpha TaxID=45954 RepID=A0A9D4S0A5_DREPO|nr:hypothetical protein DPMN_009701 [Dreissena polymorpha]